jgi:hypothetical protein
MAKAVWPGGGVAESDKTIEVEGNQYFPPDAIRKEYFKPSARPVERDRELFRRRSQWKAQCRGSLVLPRTKAGGVTD